MRSRIRLTESDIRRIVKQSVKRFINEGIGMTSEDAWEAVRKAKENDDADAYYTAVKQLEQALREEGKLIGGHMRGKADRSWEATEFDKDGNPNQFTRNSKGTRRSSAYVRDF